MMGLVVGYRVALTTLMLVFGADAALARPPKPKNTGASPSSSTNPQPALGAGTSGSDAAAAGTMDHDATATGGATPAAPAPAVASPAAPATGAARGAAGASPPAERRKKVAVLELSGLGTSDITKNLEQYLRNSLATISGFQVISLVDVQMVLQDPKNRAVAACGGGPDCATKVGKLVGSDVVIIGSITGLGEAFSLNLRALDVQRNKELARYQANVSGRDKLIPEVRLAAYRLVAPERIKGWLVVEIDVAGVGIEIDGTSVGTTPLAEPLANLAPGKHVVVIKRPGYVPFQQEFVIRPFEPTKLKIELDKAAK